MQLLLLLAAAFDAAAWEKQAVEIVRGFDGRVGVCVSDGRQTGCLRRDERFSMQSVMKLIVGVVVMDHVDQGRWRVGDQVTLRKSDLSLAVQPIAELVGPNGYTTTIGDLVRRAIIQSDSAAVDFLLARLGGPAAVKAWLARHRIGGLRLDRDERHLQTEIIGMQWKPEFVESAVLQAAIRAVPGEVRTRAYRRYQKDPRDTSTPAAMVDLLHRLYTGRLLSPTATRFVLQAMEECVTFPDRIKAGAPTGWTVLHKTGTSGSWQGVTAATNDVGVLTSPAGQPLSIAIFVADSKASPPERAALMARLSAAAARHLRN